MIDFNIHSVGRISFSPVLVFCLGVLACLASVSTTRAQAMTAEQQVRAWYQEEERELRYTPQLAELLRKCDEWAQKNDDMCISFDYFVDGQDHQINRLSLRTMARTQTTATVRARFRNFNQPTTIILQMKLVDGQWAIDDMSNPKYGCRFSEMLQALSADHRCRM